MRFATIRARRLLIALVVLATLVAGLALYGKVRPDKAGAPIGLFTSLPILWNESADLGGQLRGNVPPHWARAVLAGRGRLVPLDTLGAPGGPGALGPLKRLVVAQPRPLSPEENVALDAWVRGGGHLLLLADPALTAESAFPVGDPRRPQPVVLLSPILRHWGVELRFDDGQAFGEKPVEGPGAPIPVNLAGHFAITGASPCHVWSAGLGMTCAIGKGRVVALADAAVLDSEDPDGTRARALGALLDSAFPAR